MKFEIDYSTRPFNPKRGSYFATGFSLLFLLFSLYLSFNNYRTHIPHEVEVSYYKHNLQSEERHINNGILRTSPKTTFIIKSKNYFQYFILEFNPSSRNYFSLFFTINLFIISIILAIGSRKSSKEIIFTKELLSSLNFLSAYILIMMISKLALTIYIHDYIKKLSNNEVMVSWESSSINFFYFQGCLMLCVIFISYYKKGVELQQEKDLTI